MPTSKGLDHERAVRAARAVKVPVDERDPVVVVDPLGAAMDVSDVLDHIRQGDFQAALTERTDHLAELAGFFMRINAAGRENLVAVGMRALEREALLLDHLFGHKASPRGIIELTPANGTLFHFGLALAAD